MFSYDLRPVYTIAFSYRIGFISDWPSVYMKPFRFISDWSPVYMRTHRSCTLHIISAGKRSGSDMKPNQCQVNCPVRYQFNTERNLIINSTSLPLIQSAAQFAQWMRKANSDTISA